MKKIHWVWFVVALCALTFARFYHLSNIGIWDDDAAVYVTVIHKWLDGNYYIGASKPGYYLLGLITAKLIGMYDDTILYLNSFMDLLGIALVYLFAIRVKIHWQIALSAILMYGFLPGILFENTRGLTHLPSMTITVLSFIFYWQTTSSHWSKFVYMWLCGMTAAYAGMVHPTVFALLPIYASLICLENYKSFFSFSGIKHIFTLSLTYALGILTTFCSMVYIFSLTSNNYLKAWNEFMGELFVHHETATQGVGGHLIQKIWVLKDVFGEIFMMFASPIVIVSMIFGIGCIISRQSKKFPIELQRFILVIWIFVSMFIMINVVINQGVLSRLFLPILPFFILGAYAFWSALHVPNRYRWFGPLFLAIHIAIAGIHVSQNLNVITKPASIYRVIANQLAHRVNKDNRALLLPSNFDLTLRETLYIDAKWYYRLRRPWRPQIDLLKVYRIRYIIFANDLNTASPTDEELKQSALEKQLFRSWLRDNGSKPIYQDERLTIFELDYPPIERDAIIFTPLTLPFYNSLMANYVGPRFYRLTEFRE